MQTTKTYVRKTYMGSIGGGLLGPKTFLYEYPADLVPLARDHGTQRDELYELVTEAVSGISSARLDTLVKVGWMRDKAARLAAERAEDEREYERLRKKLGKS
jgi:hypothetical protein